LADDGHRVRPHHLADVGDILPMPAFQLGQRLRVEIEVMEARAPDARDQRASVFPSRSTGALTR